MESDVSDEPRVDRDATVLSVPSIHEHHGDILTGGAVHCAAFAEHGRRRRFPAAADEDRAAIRQLFAFLYAQKPRPIEGIDYAVHSQIYRGASIGGDIADVYAVDGNRVSFLIADVCGKGAQAALHSAILKIGARCYASAGFDPKHVMSQLNRMFNDHTNFEHAPSFASCFIAVLDKTSGRLTYCNAGHEPVLLIYPDGRYAFLPPTGPVLGVFPEDAVEYAKRTIALEADVRLVAATDGITEARSPGGRFFGTERFLQAVAENAGASVKELAAQILRRAREFSREPLRDDVVILAARIMSSRRG